MNPFDPVDPKVSFPNLEESILAFWKANDSFRQSLRIRENSQNYTFYDGPPFATGLPHYGHILAGTIKDVIPRYQTMLGKHVPRRFGWDCHGVPVEHEMEKQLGFKNRDDIERFGIKEFCEACRGIVLKHTSEWEHTVARMGRWVDFENDYKTMDPDYMESILWVFSQLWNKGLIYEGKKVVAYSPKLASPLSNFEAGLNYKDIDDPAVTVKFELLDKTSTDFGNALPPDKGGSRGVSDGTGGVSPLIRSGERAFLSYNPALTEKARENRKNPSPAEKKLWGILAQESFEDLKFVRQKPIDNYIVDFYCAELMLAIEADGDTHAEQEEYDLKRTKKLESLGVEVIRYTNRDILQNLDGVYEDLQRKVVMRKKTLSASSGNPPSPPYQGGSPHQTPSPTADSKPRGGNQSDTSMFGKTYLLAWTTTPWTLVSNLGLAVNPENEYIRFTIQQDNDEILEKYGFKKGETYIIVKSVYEQGRQEQKGMLKDLFSSKSTKEGEDYYVLPVAKEIKGSELVGKRYKPLFPYLADLAEQAKNNGEASPLTRGAGGGKSDIYDFSNAWQIFGDDFVSAEEGTGIVHLAPTGEDDARILQANNVPLIYPFTETCYFDDTIPPLKGKYFRKDDTVEGSADNNANDWVLEELKKNGQLVKREQIRHSYPHCWRTDCALMYRGIHTFFVNVQQIKAGMIENNEKIDWIPAHLKHGRFGKILENAPDWAISRNRYWGAPIPVWKCEKCEAREVAGSVREIAEKAHKNGSFFVVRHGEAEHNVRNIISTSMDDNVKLTETGRQQARETGERLAGKKIDLVYCSPFLRTRQTAEEIVGAAGIEAKIIIDERVQEIDAGNMDGVTIPEWKAQFNSLETRFHENPHQGESSADVEKRVLEFLAELKEKHAGKNILIVTHGEIVRRFMHHFYQTSNAELYVDPPPNAEYFQFSYSARPQNDQGEIDLHRPYIDAVTFDCQKCGGVMHRVEEVLDCWFESGSMPYASNKGQFDGDQLTATELRMKPVETEQEWQRYHEIRKKELFDRYHPEIEYDPNHPDGKNPHNHPFVFLNEGTIIGAVRLDEMDENTLGLRTFAFATEFQRRGFGKKAMRLIEQFALEQGKSRVVCNANPKAIGFYEKLGYQKNFWKGDSSTGSSIPMGKKLDNSAGEVDIREMTEAEIPLFTKFALKHLWNKDGFHDLQYAIEYVKNEFTIRFGAFKDNKLIGIIAGKRYEEDSSALQARAIIVHPECRKQGIASNLLNRLNHWGIENGFTKSIIWGRNAALDFYNSLGSYKNTGKQDDPLNIGKMTHTLFEASLSVDKQLATGDWQLPNGFPADFIAEGLDQTRGWFYTLHVLGNALYQSPAFKNVIVNGIVLAEDGQKMSKSKKNYPDPQLIFDKHGADAMRFYLMNSPVVRADEMRFSEDGVAEVLRKVMLPLWNAYSFFVTYANIDEWSPVPSIQAQSSKLQTPNSKLDRWILAELGHLVRNFREKMDAYQLDAACREIPDFLDKLTNFYIRRSRRRFWKSEADADKESAFRTLYTVLRTFVQILAPISPFITESIWQNLKQEHEPESVHHTDFPDSDKFADDPELRQEIAALRTIVSLSLAIRSKKKIRVRQPLAKVKIALPPAISADQVRQNDDIIKEEVNVKEIECVSDPETLAERYAKPDARKLGPKFGKEVQHIIREAKAGNFEKQGDKVIVADKWELAPDEIEIGYIGKQGLDVESEQGIVVALETEITPELKNEGIAREIIRHLQELRKKAEYDIADRIYVKITGADQILADFNELIAAEVLAKEIGTNLTEPDAEETLETEGLKIELAVKR